MRPLPALLLAALTVTTTACDVAPSDGSDASLPRTDAQVDPVGDAGPISAADAAIDAAADVDADVDAGTVGPSSPLVDPSCTDGMFSEALPNSDANIDDLIAAYSPAEAETFLLGTLDRRYPSGALLVRQGGECIDYFLRDTSSPGAVLGQLDVIVHECGHFYDLALSAGSSDTYVFNDALQLTCASSPTFPRNSIVEDEFSAERAPCDGGFIGCDRYADTYLADDASGAQGFHMLFEEAVQYVHSLATGLAITNELGASSRSMSHRDGLLTFLWYIERYLRMARLEHPAAYTHLLEGDGGCWREAILTLWGQAWLYLEVTRDMSHLGIEDGSIEPLVNEPVLLEEIQRLRDASGCGA